MAKNTLSYCGALAPWLVGAALVPNAAWASSSSDAETLKQLQAMKAEIARLEARVAAAEERAKEAERPAPPPQTLTQQLRSQTLTSVDAGVPQETATSVDAHPSSAAPGHQYNLVNKQGNQLTFSGDVEFNVNASSDNKKGDLVFGNSAGGSGSHIDRNRYSQTGRVMLEVAGERSKNDNYASFRIQPLLDTEGTVNLDDAWFAFGQKNGWSARVGRYEAYDLFPTGADTFLGYSGNSSNELYSDGAGYSYQAKEGRGRASKAGQMMVSRQFGPVYFETSTVVGDRTELFGGPGTYHGVTLDPGSSKSTFIVRPVLAWQFAPNWKVAAGVEHNVLKNSVVDKLGNDIGQRTGYSTTLGYSTDDLQVNFNLAHLDAYKEKDSSIGTNMTWKGLGLGYIYSENDIKSAYNSSTTDPSGWAAATPPGKYHMDTFYTSYQFSNVLDIERFNVLLGGFYSRFDAHDRDNIYGGRVRFKYFL